MVNSRGIYIYSDLLSEQCGLHEYGQQHNNKIYMACADLCSVVLGSQKAVRQLYTPVQYLTFIYTIFKKKTF